MIPKLLQARQKIDIPPDAAERAFKAGKRFWRAGKEPVKAGRVRLGSKRAMAWESISPS